MVTDAVARQLALALPGAVEQDHHGFPSFRVAGRIFATLPKPDRLRAMLDEHGIRSAAAKWPDSCREFYWGKRLACVEIDLADADEPVVRDLLAEAWESKKAPVAGGSSSRILGVVSDTEPTVPESPATWENVVVGEATELVGRVLRNDKLVEEGDTQKEIAHQVREEYDEEHDRPQ